MRKTYFGWPCNHSVIVKYYNFALLLRIIAKDIENDDCYIERNTNMYVGTHCTHKFLLHLCPGKPATSSTFCLAKTEALHFYRETP